MKVRGAIIFLMLTLAACSSGGGGSDSANGSGESAVTGVRIMHAAVDAVPVDLITSAAPGRIVQRGAFAERQHFASLPTGVQHLTLAPARGGGNELFGFDINVTKGSRRTVLIFGNSTNAGLGIIGLRASVLEDLTPELPAPGSALLRVVHALVGANQIAVVAGQGLEFAPIQFGLSSDYRLVPAGSLGLSVHRRADNRLLNHGTLLLDDQAIVTVLVGGEVDYYSFLQQFDDR